jgi:hypothetical protein
MIFIKKNTMKDIKKQLRYFLSINETLENKADHLINKIKEMEMGEAYVDDNRTPGGDNTPSFDFKRYKPYSSKQHGHSDKLTTRKELNKYFPSKYKEDEDEEGLEFIGEGEMCECGGMMREGECMECGMMKEGIYDDVAGKFSKKQSFDYIEEDEEEETTPFEVKNLINGCKISKKLADESGDEASRIHAENECDLAMKALKENNDIRKIMELKSFLTESKKLVGKQFKIDKNKNKRINPEDLKLLHKSKKRKSEVDEEEMEEGNEFSGQLEKARKAGKKTFKVDGKTYPVKESIEYHIVDSLGDIIKLNENEVIDLIENIVNEEKLKSMGKHKGLSTYEKAHKESGKENKEYMKSLGTKMKDYLKDGSKGKFDMNPKAFPKGNGELGKMSKKAFQMTDDLEDINYEIAGQQFPTTDGVGYDEKRMEKYFKGDSTTGNAPGGNALDSKANERFDKMRKKNTLKKIKDQSYKRVSQPVFNETSTDKDGKLNLKLETINERKINMLNEEFDRMKDLFSYNRKTQ